MTADMLGILTGFVVAAALVAGVLPPGGAKDRSTAGLLAVSAALLLAWGIAAWNGSHGGFVLALPQPLGPLVFGLGPLGPWWAALTGVLFLAAAALQGTRPGSAGLTLVLQALLAATAWFLASRSPFALLGFWELLSYLTYFAVLRDPQRVRRAAWALLALSEAGTALLFVALVLVQSQPDASLRTAVPLLALFGFGVKAGLFPLQVWLPPAHAEARGVVSGLLSGLFTAVGVAGFLQVLRLAAPVPAGVGAVTLGAGLAGALPAALYGIVERDLKRVLAYSTLETLGLVFTGLGAAILLMAWGDGGGAVLASTGALTLLAAHAGGKFVLFAVAGHVKEESGTHWLDHLGGLGRRVPRTGLLAFVAAIGLAGLPPFGGFLGEWLLLEAFLVPLKTQPYAHVLLAVLLAVVAVVGALALTSYLRWYGVIFLGPSRTRRTDRVPDLPRPVVAGLATALLLVPASGILAGWTLPYLTARTAWLAHGPAILAATYLRPDRYRVIVQAGAALFGGVAGHAGNVLFPAGGFSVASPWDLACAILVFGAAVMLWVAPRRRRGSRRIRPWIGGLPEASPAFAYSGEGLTHPLRMALAAFYGLSPRPGSSPVHAPAHTRRYGARVILRLEEHVYGNALRLLRSATGWARRLQSGSLGDYVAYVLFATLLGMTLLALR